MSSIVVKAMLIVRNSGKLLFSRGYDTVKKQTFLRPLGGHVEFGEKGEEAIRREIQEELGCGVKNVKFLSVLENLFTYNGKQGHEIILMYEGKLADESLYPAPCLQHPALPARACLPVRACLRAARKQVLTQTGPHAGGCARVGSGLATEFSALWSRCWVYQKGSFSFMEGTRQTEAGWFSEADIAKEGLPIYPPFNYF